MHSSKEVSLPRIVDASEVSLQPGVSPPTKAPKDLIVSPLTERYQSCAIPAVLEASWQASSFGRLCRFWFPVQVVLAQGEQEDDFRLGWWVAHYAVPPSDVLTQALSVCSGVKAPRAARPGEKGEPYGTEGQKWTNTRYMQRDVEISESGAIAHFEMISQC